MNARLYRVFGPAQLGAGHAEQPATPAEWRCPMCDGLLSEHEFERARDGHTPTRMHCP